MTKLVVALSAVALGSCNGTQIASSNLSRTADNFEIVRRIVFLNGSTDTYFLAIEGRCSIKDAERQLEVSCAVNPWEYKKHILGLSDDVTYFAEELDAAGMNVYDHRVTFKPRSIIPDIDSRRSGEELVEASSQSDRR